MKQYTGHFVGTYQDDIYEGMELNIAVTTDNVDMGCAGTFLETLGKAYGWTLMSVQLDEEVE